jgi:fructose-1-phosphate kinase PfkB-like protein
MRDSVVDFAKAMEAKLQAKDAAHPGGWGQDTAQDLFERLGEKAVALGFLLGVHDAPFTAAVLGIPIPTKVIPVGEPDAEGRQDTTITTDIEATAAAIMARLEGRAIPELCVDVANFSMMVRDVSKGRIYNK